MVPALQASSLLKSFFEHLRGMQVVSWNDLIVQFERAVAGFSSRMLSEGAERRWRDPIVVRRYFERAGGAAPMATNGGGGAGGRHGRGGLHNISDNLDAGYAEESSALAADGWNSAQYLKWGPFSHAWDVRSVPHSFSCNTARTSAYCAKHRVVAFTIRVDVPHQATIPVGCTASLQYTLRTILHRHTAHACRASSPTCAPRT
jgi:hypothetical protein